MFKLAMPPRNCSSSLRILAVTLLLLVSLHLYLSLPSQAPYRKKVVDFLKQYNHDGCEAFIGLDRIVITVKTGATEAPEKIPTLLRTSLRCAPHVYVFSDLDEQLGSTHIYDALDTIPDTIKDNNEDFEIYRKQQALRDHPSQIPASLRNFSLPSQPDTLAAWSLDKWKNLHIIEKAWALQPDMDWYLHIDADTYVLMPTLAAWLQSLDPSQQSYYGAMTFMDNQAFAHGGSGILLSGAATRNFAVTHNGTAARWDSRMHTHCCGDFALSRALHAMGIDLENASPTLVGETPETIPFSPSQWCQPLVTQHHIKPEEAERLQKFEEQRQNRSDPILYAEIFNDLVLAAIPDEPLADWDNMSADETVPYISTAANCSAACAGQPSCFQSLYAGGECKLSTTNFRFGERRAPEDGRTWVSSWNKTRMAAWVQARGPCGNASFPPFQEW